MTTITQRYPTGMAAISLAGLAGKDSGKSGKSQQALASAGRQGQASLLTAGEENRQAGKLAGKPAS